MISVNLHLLALALLCITQIVCSKEETTEQKPEDESLSRMKRGGLNMLRLGRGLQMLRLGKRTNFPMFRMGRSQPEPEDSDEELKELILEILMQKQAEKSALEDYNYPAPYPHPPSFPRFKRSLPDYPETPKEVEIPDLDKLQEGGFEDKNEDDKINEYYPISYPEMEEEEAYQKRALGMLRLGRSGTDDGITEEQKRRMSMLRMGKRPMSMLRMGKRPMSMLRMGKRPMSMLRMGKRPMSMLRMGKRPMSMLRMGKRPMSMLRMGKRPMSMLRMGKRPMSMLRMGKKSDDEHSVETRGLSMLRLGRST
ncbi:myomodulin neuropeptides 1 [Patella vulgata]|uniref:myomodulin neuropeptides 1 n=1 Tax=Patella vulgata TaxID=6465 RepID=UPI00217F630C|nr:myomodulin neuropeptides 1 [Patella vulgata]